MVNFFFLSIKMKNVLQETSNHFVAMHCGSLISAKAESQGA